MPYPESGSNLDKKIRGVLGTLGGILCALIVSTAFKEPAHLEGSQEVLPHWVQPLAQQVVSQAEGLALTAKLQGMLEPELAFGFAAKMLSQGNDPRIIRVEVIERKKGRTDALFEADPKTHEVNFERMVAPERGIGLKVKLALGKNALSTGRFGGWRAIKDVSLILAFFTGFLAVFGILSFRTASPHFVEAIVAATVAPTVIAPAAPPAAPEIKLDPIRETVSQWLQESRQVLTQLGTAVRDLLKQTDQVAKSGVETREQVKKLKLELNQQLSELRKINRGTTTDQANMDKIELLALHLVTDLLQEGAKPNAQKNSQALITEIKRFRQARLNAQSISVKLEKAIEPLAADALEIEQSLESTSQKAVQLDGHIQNTTAHLMNQAKMVQKLKGYLK